jgi:protein TonB
LPITFKLGNPATTDEKPVVEIEAETESTENIELTKEDTGEGEVLQVAERMPMFPGGDETLINWLYHAIKYPSIAHDKGIQGRVMVQFTVNKDGSIVDTEIFKGVHPSLDEEALKVVKSMPKWTPGMQKGKTVRVRYTMPIMFRLQ